MWYNWNFTGSNFHSRTERKSGNGENKFSGKFLIRWYKTWNVGLHVQLEFPDMRRNTTCMLYAAKSLLMIRSWSNSPLQSDHSRCDHQHDGVKLPLFVNDLHCWWMKGRYWDKWKSAAKLNSINISWVTVNNLFVQGRKFTCNERTPLKEIPLSPSKYE